MEKTSEKRAGYTRNGNKHFDGTEGKRFSSEYQPTPEAKSEGWQERNLREALIERLAEKLFEAKAPDIAVANSLCDAEKGNIKNLIELIKIIKMPDKFTMDSKFDVKQLVLEVVKDETGADQDEDASEIPSVNH